MFIKQYNKLNLTTTLSRVKFATKHFLHETAVLLPESVGALMPAELTADAVSDGGHELPAQPQVLAQVPGEAFGAVLRVRHVPLELVHQAAVSNVNVQLENFKCLLVT